MVSAFSGTAAAQQKPLLDLSLEELANLEITSVSRRPERIADAAASVYVIRNEDIRRSGARTLPEALRLAPNLHVARIDSGQYAISARGFNNAIANKLLVLVDGRTVYTPFFSGVFWEQQDVMLEDVERIEVISGPGGTLWGANAVNGVINVITRSARDTQGTLVSIGGTGEDRTAALRYGAALDGGGHFRLYGKTGNMRNTYLPNGAPVTDARDFSQAGFRADWSEFTLQGDAYSGATEARPVFGPVEVSGMNLLGRWSRRLAGGSDLSVQAYLDRTEHEDALLFQPHSDIFDVQLQHGVPHGAHRFLWGAGYRRADDDSEAGVIFGFVPRKRVLDWANVFAQEELRLGAGLELTLGVKLERNDYTGVEKLPSARLAWKPADSLLLWSALSRAVRAPARLDRDLRVPAVQPPVIIAGGGSFDSEIADVLEVGLRAQPWSSLSFSATAFYTEWDRLRSGQLPPAMVQNRIEGDTHGIEAWGAWQATPALRISAGGTNLKKHLVVEPGANDPTGPSALGNDPGYQWMARAAANLGAGHELDAAVRRVGGLPNPALVGYTAFDLRYAWRTRELELAATLQNAFDPDHAEFRSGAGAPSEIERTLFLSARWTM